MTGSKLDGDLINDSLHNFKLWFSDFAIELSPLFVLAGMVLTGVDIYLNGRLATQMYFEIPWSIVQVIAIDGLWFAVWLRILEHEHRPNWQSRLRFMAMLIVGMAMIAVAFFMSDIVLFQQVEAIPVASQAMASLHIPVDWFTHFRALLLVATATLAMLFSRKRHITRSQAKAKVATVKATGETTIREEKSTPPLLPESTQSTAEDRKKSIQYLQLKMIMADMKNSNLRLTQEELADRAQVSLGMVKKHAPKIRQELGL